MFNSIKKLFGHKQPTPWLTQEMEDKMTREDWDRLFPVNSKPPTIHDAPPITTEHPSDASFKEWYDNRSWWQKLY